MCGHPAWHKLCGHFAEMIGRYLVAQIEAGVDAVQVFDSWVGALNAVDYREFIPPHQTDLRASGGPPVGADHTFRWARGPSSPRCARAGGDVIGADWRTPIDEAWARIGFDRAVQGNLDPTLLLGPLSRLFAAPTM